MLLVDPVGAVALFRFEGLDGVASLLHRAGHEPADCVLLPSHLVHDLGQGSPILPLEQIDHLSGLAALARSRALLFFGGPFGFRRVLGRRYETGNLPRG